MSYANAPYPSHLTASVSNTGSIASTMGSDVRRTSSIAQPMVASASTLPAGPSKENHNHHPLDQIFEQTRQFHSNREKSHDDERNLWQQERETWQKERKEFLERINQLEASITNLMRNGCVPLSPGGTIMSMNQHSSNHKLPSPPISHHGSTSRPIWEGTESPTTRTWSDSAVPSLSRQFDRMHSIAETTERPDRKKSVGFSIADPTTQTRHVSLPGIPGELIHPDYSGITLKPNSLPPELKKAAEEAAAETSPRSPSPLSVSAITPTAPEPVIRPKLLDIPTANMHSEDLYSADAGHTPLARVTGSEGTTGTLTPTAIEVERPPLEPHPTQAVIRPPHERQDSYFANASTTADGAADEVPEVDQDPALQAPLGVSAENTSQDSHFLDKVNEALEKNLHEEDESVNTSPEAEKTHNRGLSEADDFPKLRMKASTNFGAPFGKSEPARNH